MSEDGLSGRHRRTVRQRSLLTLLVLLAVSAPWIVQDVAFGILMAGVAISAAVITWSWLRLKGVSPISRDGRLYGAIDPHAQLPDLVARQSLSRFRAGLHRLSVKPTILGRVSFDPDVSWEPVWIDRWAGMDGFSIPLSDIRFARLEEGSSALSEVTLVLQAGGTVAIKVSSLAEWRSALEDYHVLVRPLSAGVGSTRSHNR